MVVLTKKPTRIEGEVSIVLLKTFYKTAKNVGIDNALKGCSIALATICSALQDEKVDKKVLDTFLVDVVEILRKNDVEAMFLVKPKVR